MSQPNYDESAGIHYGVIHQNEVLQAWADSSEPVFPDDPPEDSDYDLDPGDFAYDAEGYKCQGDSCGDIFIIKSPYYAFCKPCSPCAPNAGCLISHTPDGIMSYCFGHDWFEDGKAPYKVYDVKTNKEVTQ